MQDCGIWTVVVKIVSFQIMLSNSLGHLVCKSKGVLCTVATPLIPATQGANAGGSQGLGQPGNLRKPWLRIKTTSRGHKNSLVKATTGPI